MARAIDADIFIRDLTAMKKMYDAIELDGMIKALKEAPTIDTVKHGKWEEMRNAYGELEGWIHAECGREVKCMENFCPNCGARMDGE